METFTTIDFPGAHPISALQSEYSLWERNLEPGIIPVLRELGIGLVPFAPLGRGFLTGSAKRSEEYPPNDWRFHDPRFQGANFDRNMRAAAGVARTGGRPERYPGASGDGVAVAQGQRHRAHPRHQAAELPGRERGCGGALAERGRDGAPVCGHAARSRGWPALQRPADGLHRPVSTSKTAVTAAVFERRIRFLSAESMT